MAALITPLLMLLAGAAKAVMDTLQFHFSTSIFKRLGTWWNPRKSYLLKYRVRFENGKRVLRPRFPGSTTWLIWLTDGWHLWQFIFLKLIIAAIILYKPVTPWKLLDAGLLLLELCGAFEICFRLFSDDKR